MHDSLSTNAFRGLHHLTTNTTCPKCVVVVESDMHTLRDCPSAMNVLVGWPHLVLPTSTL